MLHSATITKPKRNVFAVLDIGSTKIVCLIVKVNNSNEPQVIGIGYKIADGVNGGAITHIKRATQSVLSTVDVAEQVAGESIEQVYLNLSGCGVSSSNISHEIISSNHEITDRDIKRIILQTYDKCNNQEVIIHNIPVNYSLDDIDNITELRGLYGSKLRADMHVVSGSRAALMNVENCITSCNLNMAGCITESYASGISCLTEDEREVGAVVIDIGGGHTSIGMFDKGKFVHADYIPIGGIHVTRDIAYGLCVSVAEAERIKILHGNIILTSADENKYFTITGDHPDESIHIPKAKLVNIIRPRIEEILEIIRNKLENRKSLTSKIVITGGGSQIASMKEIAGHVLNRPIRIGLPIDISGLDAEYARNPVFSASVGIATLITEMFYKNKNEYQVDRENKFKKLFAWIARS